jgi:hypothetical protein
MWPVVGLVAGTLLILGSLVWMYADSHSTMRDIQIALKRYVLPRHLTDQQSAAISQYLKQRQPFEAKVIAVKNNTEASRYAEDIRQALIKGGWTVAPADTFAPDDVPPDVSIAYIQTLQSGRNPYDPSHPEAGTCSSKLSQARM